MAICLVTAYCIYSGRCVSKTVLKSAPPTFDPSKLLVNTRALTSSAVIQSVNPMRVIRDSGEATVSSLEMVPFGATPGQVVLRAPVDTSVAGASEGGGANRGSALSPPKQPAAMTFQERQREWFRHPDDQRVSMEPMHAATASVSPSASAAGRASRRSLPVSSSSVSVPLAASPSQSRSSGGSPQDSKDIHRHSPGAHNPRLGSPQTSPPTIAHAPDRTASAGPGGTGSGRGAAADAASLKTASPRLSKSSSLAHRAPPPPARPMTFQVSREQRGSSVWKIGPAAPLSRPTLAGASARVVQTP